MGRILYLITKSELGGAQTNVADLIEGFSGAHEVHLGTSVEGPLTERARQCGAQVHLLPRLQRSIQPWHDAFAVRECSALIRQIKPHLIHAHSSKAGVVGRVAGALAGVPVIFTAHGWGFSPGTPPARRALAWLVEKAVAPLSARIVCVSESDRRLALRCRVGRRSRLVTIRYGLPPAAVPADPAPQPPRLLMVARFSEQKDQTTLLHAVAQMKPPGSEPGEEKAPQFCLDLIGSGPDFHTVRALAEQLKVLDRVSFLGDRHDVPELLSAAQVFVLSTHYEGLPISIMEALRAGLPVIATDVSGIPEEVAHGKNGFLVPHLDAPALARALQQMVESPALRCEMGRASRQKFLDEFTLERMLSQFETLYQQVAPLADAPGWRRKTP